VARREESNTPLQALTVLNDAVFIEAAQALGAQDLTIGQGDAPLHDRLTLVFRRCLARPPTAEECDLLTQYYSAQLTRLKAKELDAEKIAGAGEGDVVERAAWTLTARTILNLDETITKQ
jgi:hypothetical protein